MGIKQAIKIAFSLTLSLLFTSIGNAQTSYCSSSSTNFSYEFIKQVTVGSMSHSSLGTRYSNFTATPNLVTPASVQRGSSVLYSLLPGFSGAAYQEEWAIFIDFNQNGTFTDAGEKVASNRSTSSSAISGYFGVPTAARLGTTRMRVSMQYATQPPPCGSFTYGEVEDYLITISSQISPTPTPYTPTPTPTLYTPTPTPTPYTPYPTPTAQCTPAPCTPPSTPVCPGGNCQNGCGYVCSAPPLPAGSLDSTFGVNGKISVPLPGGVTVARAATQPDGKFIIGGVLGSQTGVNTDDERRGTLFVSRFLQNGSPDITFGNSGSAIIYSGVYYNRTRLRDLSLQPDGKILLLTEANDDQYYGATYLWRFNSSGALDSTFGVNGRVSISPTFLTPRALAFQADGKILVAGDSANSGPRNIRLVRLLSNGVVDSSFGLNGEFKRPTAYVSYTQVGVTLVNGQERILVVSIAETEKLLTLIRLTPTGTMDPSFGSNGILTHTVDPNYTTLQGFALGNDGRGFSFGQSAPAPTYSNKYYIARTKVNGSLDETFGPANGIVHNPWSGLIIPRTFTIQTSSPSSQLGGGWPRALVSLAGTGGAKIERLSEIGAPDLTFGNSGSVTLSDMTSGGRLLKVMGDSRLLVVGANAQGIVMYRLGL